MKWEEMSWVEKIKFDTYGIPCFALYFSLTIIFSFLGVYWAVAPFAVLAIVFAIQFESAKKGMVLLDEIKGLK